MPAKRPIAERLWEKVDVRGPDDCWNWTAYVGTHGYGSIARTGKSPTTAPRVAYELAYGPMTEREVLHCCDNRLCCNPRHLSQGSSRDNKQDAVKKGRYPLGLKRASGKLSDDQVREIRADPRTPSIIAKGYGVSRPLVANIKSGRARSHVT